MEIGTFCRPPSSEHSARGLFALLSLALLNLAAPHSAADPGPSRPGEVRLDRLEHLTSRDGLTQNWILHLEQDRQGFLWIGTDDGLNRYDGYGFKTYRNDPGDARTISHNFIECTHEDSRGNLWIGTRGGLNRLDRSADVFTRFRHDPARADSLSHDIVTDIHEDRRGVLWIGTRDGVNRFDPSTQSFSRFHHDPEDPGSLSRSAIWRIYESRSGDLWFGDSDGTLNKLERSGHRFLRYPLLDGSAAAQDREIRGLAEDAQGRLWIGMIGGALVRFDPRTGERTRYLDNLPDIELIYSVHRRPDGTLWVGTGYHGLLILDPESGNVSVYKHDPDEIGSLSNNRVMTVYEDRGGVIWLGTDTGLNKFAPHRERFTVYRHKTSDPDSLSGDFIWPVYEDREGLLWVGTVSSGLNRLDRARGVNRRYTHDPEDPDSLSNDEVSCIFEDSAGTLWIATGKGLDRLDEEGKAFGHLRLRPGDPDGLIEGSIYAIVESDDGMLWLGGGGGLYRLDVPSMRLQRYRHDPEDPTGLAPGTLYAMLIDRRGELWIGTDIGGLSRFDPRRETFHHYLHDPDDPDSLGSNGIGALYEDRTGILWVGTLGGGLNRFDRARGTFVHFREKDGLSNDNVLGILEDDRGRLWLSTNRGLNRFDPRSEAFKVYGIEDGLQDDAFGFRSAWRSKSGEMFFGSPSGLVSFFPDRLVSDPYVPPVAITDFQIFNRSTPLAAHLSPEAAENDADAAPRLVLSHRDDVFAFEFAALHFASPGKNRYAHKLDGVDRDWVETASRMRFAQYTNLDSGDYAFRVKAANPDGVWNEAGASVRLTILPPPWRTWWAYALYGTALVALALGCVRWQQGRLRRERRAAQRERAVSARLREVDRLKDEFLANTSHELRTPLYGITGLAESLIDGARGALPDAARADLSMLVASGRRLAALVNDILDFSKLSHKSVQLERRAVDLRALTEVVLAMSRPLVGSKDLELRNSIGTDLQPVLADENRLQQILYNLVGNAIKFSESGSVDVSAVARGDQLLVAVEDTGIGIEEEAKARIFEAFAQADASTERVFGGTGLGLAVVRQLVELHGGTLCVESTPGEGSTFFFSLPTAMEEAAPSPVTDPIAGLVTNESAAGEVTAQPAAERPVAHGDSADILVVDDEPVIRRILVNQLTAQGYRITEAPSGSEALRRIDERSYDMVLLDVMMPRMSGYEVCRTLREKYTPEGLPVIFLTAKNQVEDLVVGLAAGANDYLPKPILKDELLARVKTHLSLLGVHRQLASLVAERTDQVAERDDLLHERQRLIVELEERNADLARFNYTVSHDLKNPLVTIKNFVGVLRRDAAAGRTQRMQHDLDRLEKAAETMHRQLDELYNFSRVGYRAEAWEEISFADLVHEASTSLAGPIAKCGIEVDVADDLPAVRGDRARLLEMVHHLLANAVSYLGDQTEPRIEVGVRRQEADVVFYVRDNGMGIDARYHDKVFGLFERLHPEDSEGTGIGLPLVKRIVEVHEGRVWVESEGKDRGSTFCFTLPRRQTKHTEPVPTSPQHTSIAI